MVCIAGATPCDDSMVIDESPSQDDGATTPGEPGMIYDLENAVSVLAHVCTTFSQLPND